MIVSCSNPAQWHPTLHRREVHHNPPRSWTLDDGDSSELIPLCGLCHNEAHALYNLYVHADGVPPWSERRTFSPFIRRLVARGWILRTPGRTPWTSASGTVAA